MELTSSTEAMADSPTQESCPEYSTLYPPSPPAASPPTPITFPQFARLPPELQIKVWTYALPPPRVIRLSPRTFASHPGASGISAPHAPPILLRTCALSRAVTLRHYKRAFRTVQIKSTTAPSSVPIVPGTYINFSRDAVFLDVQVDSQQELLFELIDREEYLHMRTLALLLKPDASLRLSVPYFVHRIPQLEELVLVLAKENAGRVGDEELEGLVLGRDTKARERESLTINLREEVVTKLEAFKREWKLKSWIVPRIVFRIWKVDFRSLNAVCLSDREAETVPRPIMRRTSSLG